MLETPIAIVLRQTVPSTVISKARPTIPHCQRRQDFPGHHHRLWEGGFFYTMSAQKQQQVPAKKQQDLQATYSNYKNTLQQVAQKIGDIEQEAEEHKFVFPVPPPRPRGLVLETLEPLSEDRKCFRLINGVLVERTVKDVVPALRTNQEGLRKVLDDLVKQYKAKQDELDKWKAKNNVQVVQQ
ncbi:hypothetical protein RJ55_01499 [Drechmeria coniospora]|nr:hypothetical protein RJ55_01499 [Drechmeria coniospora]